jgi:hypothetical protein
MKVKLLNLSLVALLITGFHVFNLSSQDLIRQIQTAVGIQPTEQQTIQAQQPKVSPAMRAQKRVARWKTIIRGLRCIGLSDESDDMRTAYKYLRRAEHAAATGMPYKKPKYVTTKKAKAPLVKPKKAAKKATKEAKATTKATAAQKKRKAEKK